MWHLRLEDNNITYSLARQNFSNDISIIGLTDNSEHETFYLTSPHFSDLPIEEYEKAYYKALSFLRLINGCLLLKDDYLLHAADNRLTHFDDSYNAMRKGKEVYSRSLIEYEQLVNPFENLQIEDLESKSYLANCLTMVKNDQTVRRVIGLLYLYHRDNLYLLINAYKIYELIFADLGIERKEKSYKKMRNDLSPELLPYLDYFLLGDFKHYANTVASSDGTEMSGIFSRHGQSKDVYDKKPIDIKEFDLKLRNLINKWLSIKIENQIGVVHKEDYQSRDDDFFDI